MKRILVTGGCGFIGSNLMDRLLARGESAVAFDNLSRHGVSHNADWLRGKYGSRFELIKADIRDEHALVQAAEEADIIYHLAAQVAVTTSILDPRTDFQINALGTINALEAARLSGRNPVFIFASTNKVYNGVNQHFISERSTRYENSDLPYGISETQPLDFHSPYSCSKGAADQYVRDYHRIFGLRTVVFRQSAIYGPRQFGIEDQGWLAWFIIAALLGKPVTIYGNGKQVRDVLYIEDLLDAYDAAVSGIDCSAGQIYNIGGGCHNSIAVWTEFGPMLEKLLGRTVPVTYGDWRPGDQKVCIYDISKAALELGWAPSVQLERGMGAVYDWIRDNMNLFEEVAGGR